MKEKRFLSVLIALVLVTVVTSSFLLTACGEKDNGNDISFEEFASKFENKANYSIEIISTYPDYQSFEKSSTIIHREGESIYTITKYDEEIGMEFFFCKEDSSYYMYSKNVNAWERSPVSQGMVVSYYGDYVAMVNPELFEYSNEKSGYVLKNESFRVVESDFGYEYKNMFAKMDNGKCVITYDTYQYREVDNNPSEELYMFTSVLTIYDLGTTKVTLPVV